jgi:exopolysaccharide production protein ExoY
MTLHIRAPGASTLSASLARVDVPWAAQGAQALPDLPLPELRGGYAGIGKRAVDIVMSAIILVLIAPVLALLSALLWMEGGNPFFVQVRLGKDGRRFNMWKLRSMVPNADALLEAHLARDPALRHEWDLTQKLKRDPRITPIGRFIRMTSLDELPQVFNVLTGDMSLVGPRPMLPDQLALYDNPAAYFAVRPGITGLWQVEARNEAAFALRSYYDTLYVNRLSASADLGILLRTFKVMVRATGY